MHLTNREKTLVKLLKKSFRNKDIGILMSIKESTVKIMNTRVYKKYGVKNRMEFINKTRK